MSQQLPTLKCTRATDQRHTNATKLKFLHASEASEAKTESRTRARQRTRFASRLSAAPPKRAQQAERRWRKRPRSGSFGQRRGAGERGAKLPRGVGGYQEIAIQCVTNRPRDMHATNCPSSTIDRQTKPLAASAEHKCLPTHSTIILVSIVFTMVSCPLLPAK